MTEHIDEEAYEPGPAVPDPATWDELTEWIRMGDEAERARAAYMYHAGRSFAARDLQILAKLRDRWPWLRDLEVPS